MTAAGLGNLPAVIGTGFGLGLIEQYTGIIMGAEYQVAAAVVMLLVVLIWRQISNASSKTGGVVMSNKTKTFISRYPCSWGYWPAVLPQYTQQMAVMWVMVLMASTWDLLGGQTGYNSLGNITFFGAGMYFSAIIQISMFYNVADYTSAFGAIKPEFTESQYYTGLYLGIIGGGIGAAILLFGTFMFGLRGPYFAIGTLGLAVAAGQLTGTFDYVGGGSGISMPFFPGDIEFRSLFFYSFCFALAALAHFVLRWMYSTQFGLAINAIRDDEDKAEAMGIPTLLHKQIGWAVTAFFMGCVGAVFGNMVGFIEPVEVAFPTATFGIFMVAMALLGGRYIMGTCCGCGSFPYR